MASAAPASTVLFRTRRRHARRSRWLWILEQLGLTPSGWFGPGLASCLLLVLSACEVPIAEVRIKMPREAVQSTKADPTIPTFTQKSETMQFRASAFDAKGRYKGPAEVKWSVLDPTVATVSQDGLLSILGSGKTKLKIETRGENVVSHEIEIHSSIPAKVEIVPPEGDQTPNKIHMGETKQFKARVLDDRGNEISDAKVLWQGSNYGITVTPDGEIEGRAMGDVKLVAEESKSGLTASLELDVLDWKKGSK